MLAKCSCVHCNGSIEFDVAELGDEKFRVINCPHCGKETVLTYQATQSVPPPIQQPQVIYVQPPSTPPSQTIYVKEKPKTGCLTQIIAAFLVFLLICFVVGLVETSNQTSQSSSPSGNSSDKPAVEISNVEGQETDYGGMEITGIIQNLCSVSLNSVTVRFSIFDSDGNKVDDTIDYTSSLDAGGTWKFKANSLKETGKKYRLDGISSREGELEMKVDK